MGGRVRDDRRSTDELVKLGVVQHPAGKPVSRDPSAQLRHRRVDAAGHEDDVAVSPPAQHRRVGDQTDPREGGAERGHLGTRVLKRRAVGEIDDQEAGGASARAAAWANSTDVNRAGVRAPAKTSEMTRS